MITKKQKNDTKKIKKEAERREEKRLNGGYWCLKILLLLPGAISYVLNKRGSLIYQTSFFFD